MKKFIGIICGIYAIIYYGMFIMSLIKGEKVLPGNYFFLHHIAFACVGYILFAFVFPKMIFKNREGLLKKHRLICDGEKAIYKKMFSGRIGLMRLKNTLKLEIYSKGAVFKVPFIDPIAIANEEIEGLCAGTNSFRKCIEIHHKSSFVSSPLILFTDKNQRIIQELKARVE